MFCQPYVNSVKVYLPPLHIKLGLMKNFIKAKDHMGKAFFFFPKSKFLGISDAKIKEGIFVGLQIRKLMKDPEFEQWLIKAAPWGSFQNAARSFLGNKQVKNFKELINDLLENYRALGCNVSENPFFRFAFGLFFGKILSM